MSESHSNKHSNKYSFPEDSSSYFGERNTNKPYNKTDADKLIAEQKQAKDNIVSPVRQHLPGDYGGRRRRKSRGRKSRGRKSKSRRSRGRKSRRR